MPAPLVAIVGGADPERNQRQPSVIGGLTVETVFRKLLGVDVVHTTAIAVRGDGPAPPAREPKK